MNITFQIKKKYLYMFYIVKMDIKGVCNPLC